MSVKWPLIYQHAGPVGWYRVKTVTGDRFMMMVNMDDILVSMPYFSYAHFSDQEPELVEKHPVFTLEEGKLQCSDPAIQWHVRMLKPVSGHFHTVKVVSWLPLETTAEKQLLRFSSNLRRKINKSVSREIKLEVGGSELIGKFYGVFSHNMHRLGAPAMSKSFYARVVTAFGRDASVLIALYHGKAIGGAILLKKGEFAETCWFSTLEDYNPFYTSYFLWWECIRLSIERECKVFSFGRSTKDSGPHLYKQQWGVKNTTLYWSFSYPLRNDQYTIGPLKIPMPNRKILSFLWKISPCFIIRWLGPMVAGKFY